MRSNNSWMHNNASLMEGKGHPTCTLLVHPADATRYQLVDGEPASVTSAAGTIEVPVEISDEVMTGVVSLPHGWGHNRVGAQLGVAAKHPGSSINDVTDETFVDTLTGTAALSGVPVTVAPVA